MTLAVDQPIINDPYQEPTRWWDYQQGQPVLMDGRRPAGYYMAPRTRARAGAVAQEEFVRLDSVNEIRARVTRWREAGYPGTTQLTKELLRHWSSPEREGRHRLFFCQREAVETIIWMVEGPERDRRGLDIPTDAPQDAESIEKRYRALQRYCCKMATASGKTVVMAMVIAWSVLNKAYNPQDRRFSDAVLVVCPNLTVKERLAGRPADPDSRKPLIPGAPGNYYEEFDLVPRSLLAALGKGKYYVTNWHAFLPQDDENRRGVVKRGPESDRAFCNRVLGRWLGSKENILVVNDEAHHAYRPAPPAPDQPKLFDAVTGEERKRLDAETKAAKVWVAGLDRINAVRKISLCVDLSATPFYIKGSGYPEGAPLGSTPDNMRQTWIVSDFGLVDAVESGIVKIPRVPVDDNGAPYPRYFRLWQWIMEQLPASERATARRRAKPESVLRLADGAFEMLASEWKKTFDAFRESGFPIPPAMIVVCDNTGLSEAMTEHIARTQTAFPELRNTDGEQPTLRIDTRLLDKAESVLDAATTRQDAAEQLREIVATVGQEGQPGEQVRCVVSVGMLTEGWDAHNVTQILGLRAFDSQLLCEQVVGRGLRRTNYDDLSVPEYVDVYGIPFEVIPVKKTPVRGGTPPPPSTLVQALPERAHLAIKFPRVDGYVFDVRHRVRADIDAIPELRVEPSREPTEVIVKDAVGYRLSRPDRLGPGEEVVHDRDVFHGSQRRQTVEYMIAAAVTQQLKNDARRILFPQVLRIVQEFIVRRVVVATDAPLEEIALLRYRDDVVDRLCNAIEPDTEAGEAPLLPRIERFRPVGSTSEVLFRTTRPCSGTTKSHVSHVVLDAPSWEHSVAYQLERLPQVLSYVRNDHLDFTIPYDFEGYRHAYTPDFLVRWRTDDGDLTVVLEVKGYESEQDRAKESAARRWVNAVNHHGEFSRWALVVCEEPRRLGALLGDLG